MGSTVHGIKYPSMTDLPNVPSDIGGTGKLDATIQSWLAQLDVTNLANLSTQNTACAVTEANVTAASNGLTTATNRQAAQQTSINAISASNDAITSRLNTRDTTLAADSATVQGYAGQITGLQSLKPRGFLGYGDLGATNIATGGGWVVVGRVAFSDTATPNGNRQYRAASQVRVFDNSGLSNTSYTVNLGLFYTAGSTFGTSRRLGSAVAALDTEIVTVATTWMDVIFTAVTDPQWTVWLAAQQIAGIQYTAAMIGDFMTLEDVGLSI
jgi:hypothetical protein